MKQNFKGRIKNFNLPAKDAMVPIYEAIMNSIQAINDRGIDDGNVFIELINNTSLVETGIIDIDDVKIIDNGIGFNKVNFDAFQTCDTDHREKEGGRGVGRLNWLKAFTLVEVSSVFEEDGIREKTFKFDEDEGVFGEKNARKSIDSDICTVITLKGLKEIYRKKLSYTLEQFANKISEHFSELLILHRCPRIEIKYKENKISINDYFNKERFISNEEQEISIHEGKYFLKHVLIKADTSSKHKIFLCANNRVVQSFDIVDIEDLPPNFTDEQMGDFIYQCFVSSTSLDGDVNAERNGFNNIIFEKEQDSLFANQNIYRDIYDEIGKYLNKYIAPYISEKNDIIKNYISNEVPEFNYLMEKNEQDLAKIPLASAKSKDKLFLELTKINRKNVISTEESVNSFIKKGAISEEEFNRLVSSINDSQKVNLTAYVCKRKMILDLFEKLLGTKMDSYEKEERLHNLFIPMKKTNNELDYDDHNLWLIDEKLTFSYSFYSDQQLKSIFENSDSDKRPDALFLDAISFSEKDRNVVDNLAIIEFKRPARDDYNFGDNPITQVNKYIDEIKNRVLLGKNNEIIEVDENVRFTCYIIADITPSFKRILAGFDAKPMFSGSYFINNAANKAFIEIIPYSILLKNSRLRNRIFFKKLGIVD